MTEPGTAVALTGGELVEAAALTPVAVLTNEEMFDRLYEKMKSEADALKPDVNTSKGRQEIAALSYKVARAKTAIDKAGKELNEERRKAIGIVDAARRKIWDKLETLQGDVRKPLDDWEEAEKERLAKVDEAIDGLKLAAIVDPDETAEQVGVRRNALYEASLDPLFYLDRLPEAAALLESSRAALDMTVSRLIREEADRAELARLRQEAQEREEREALAAAEAARLAEVAAEAERQQQAALAAEEAERARIAEVERAARDAAAQEAAAAAAQAAAEVQARHDAEIEAANRAAAEAAERAREIEKQQAAAAAEERAKHDAEMAAAAERAQRAEEERAALAAVQAEAARQAEAERVAAEARQKDRDHRGAVMKVAKEAIMAAADIDEETARKVVLAIVADEIPAVTLQF